MAIELPPLPYPAHALEPYISNRTMEFHHDHHHKKYVDTTNALIKGSELENLGLEELMERAHGSNPKLYNNAAQAWNHSFFWHCLTRSSSAPSQDLKRRLLRQFDSLDHFKETFQNEGKELFGSGWTWLVLDKNGALQIRALKDAGNPLAELNEVPLLVCDVWEHAYYLDYQHERAKYLKTFWQIVNWDFIERNLESSNRDKDRSVFHSDAHADGVHARLKDV